MAEPVIEVSDVAHHFRVSSEGRVASFKTWLIHRMTGKPLRFDEHIALEGVGFRVNQGQALGVIGHNGAGKSTLLRIVAGILQPTKGLAVVHGRIAPVIELGVGFEQELTGRENIVFNGALLGRSHQEMNERMDEIVSFAELRDFIDQPIRTYSTGMVARLAFSIATTVDAQVLLLDEVLSVGDERFQRKCEARMEAFRRGGVTILFVSHGLDSVARMCDEAIWLDGGKVREFGPAERVISGYRAWADQTAAE